MGEMGNVAMGSTMRDLTVDEVELVVGGDSQIGISRCTAPYLIFRVGPVKGLVITEPCDSL
jgi:hypothetical protein